MRYGTPVVRAQTLRETIVQDTTQPTAPRRRIARPARPRDRERFLREIVGVVDVAHERAREAANPTDVSEQTLRVVRGFHVLLVAAALESTSAKRTRPSPRLEDTVRGASNSTRALYG
ncbi:MAG: hypothetical protein K8S98_10250 [Planctomycetes bacterium]|nr:hypothetical protein [Planctomycetota bacterium]